MLLSIPYIPLWESLHVPALNAKVNATTQAPTKVHNKENSNLPRLVTRIDRNKINVFLYHLCMEKTIPSLNDFQ